MEIWAKHNLEDHMPRITQMGPLYLWLTKANNEIRIAQKHKSGPNTQASRRLQPIADTESTEVSWQRWDVGLEYDGVRLPPIVPNRSRAIGRPARILIPMGTLRKKSASFPNGILTADRLPLTSDESKDSKEETPSHAD